MSVHLINGAYLKDKKSVFDVNIEFIYPFKKWPPWPLPILNVTEMLVIKGFLHLCVMVGVA